MALTTEDIDLLLNTPLDTYPEGTVGYVLKLISQIPTTTLTVDEHEQLLAIPTTGIGDVFVNHNYPTANNLSFINNDGTGIDNAIITIYLKSDYDSGNIHLTSKGNTTTTIDGTWNNGIRLDSGFTYIVEFYKQGSYQVSTVEITT